VGVEHMEVQFVPLNTNLVPSVLLYA
jgi:hypothetical protein